jgi:putative hydrolase of HD superfamily
MNSSLTAILETIQELELIKDTLRTAWTSTGRHESTAEHSWRLAMFCLVLKDYFPEANVLRLIELALCHDLGEAYTGDLAAPLQKASDKKEISEHLAVIRLFEKLPENQQQYFVDLLDEYQQGTTYEAKIIKALDKMETIIQHNQGKNPSNFDYAFNKSYGQELANFLPILKDLRQLIDAETDKH